MTLKLFRKHNQTAVHWAKNSHVGSGNTAYDAGAEVACRWEDGPQLMQDRNGLDVEVKSVVYFDDETGVLIDDQVFLGLLTDLTVGQRADPDLTSDAHKIVAIKRTPNRKNTQTLLKAGL